MWSIKLQAAGRLVHVTGSHGTLSKKTAARKTAWVSESTVRTSKSGRFRATRSQVQTDNLKRTTLSPGPFPLAADYSFNQRLRRISRTECTACGNTISISSKWVWNLREANLKPLPALGRGGIGSAAAWSGNNIRVRIFRRRLLLMEWVRGESVEE